MPRFENGDWYQGEIVAIDYIKSEKKGTPAIELTINVSDRGQIVGQWWLTDSMVNDPSDKMRKVPMWEAAKIRCKLFGCEDEPLNRNGWIAHIRERLIGQTAAVLAEVNDYGDVKAAFVGKPKGNGGGGFIKQESSSSPFINRQKQSDPWTASDDDTPF